MAVTREVRTAHSLEAAIQADHMAEDPVDPVDPVDLAEVSTAIVSNRKRAIQELPPAAPVLVNFLLHFMIPFI
ncbi:hypothetical protein DET54_11211 [Paenibacillus pabuli]|uniref:Uncharacterized protein n=1 Tax=Paenibacillus pabuli TaxID=1472 RepID=A0ABX9BFQ3_9BACL|nr:hypothetical protein DET54_11211 [Paenibacillus pabuli]